MGFINNYFFLPLTIETMNKLKILFNSSLPVTTPALTEILHREKVNVSKTYFNKYNELFVLCNSADDLDTLFSSGFNSELEAVRCKPFCLLTSKPRDHSYCRDVMIRYLIKEKKILKVKSRSRMIVLKCRKFSSIIAQKI